MHVQFTANVRAFRRMPPSPDHFAPDARTHVAGVLALELAPGSAIGRDVLAQGDAGRLAALLGRDLSALDEGVRGLDLVFAAAHFDPAEALRPGWPLHRRLHELHQRAPRRGDGPQIIAFGTDREGRAPQPLHADDDLRGGSLRVLPFLLSGDAAAVAPVSERLERVLLDRGMAGADTALCAQEAFAARIEHARALTLHDLAAMTALQYANQGLDALWRVVETALLSPGADIDVDAPPEPLLRCAGGEARIALLSPDAWRRHYVADGCSAGAVLERRFEAFEARQRQYASVLQAHGIPVTFVHCNDAADL